MRRVIAASTTLYLATISMILFIKELSHGYYGPDLGLVCNYLMFVATVLLYILHRVMPEFKTPVFKTAVGFAALMCVVSIALAGDDSLGSVLFIITIVFSVCTMTRIVRDTPRKDAPDEHTGC